MLSRMNTGQARTLAGVSFIGVGAVAILGFITAEALYPNYIMSHQTISALGAADAPPGSRLVFNAAMVLSGLLATGAAYGLHGVYGRRVLTGIVAVTGIGGFIGVGVFPAQTGLPHLIAALIAFTGAGVTALVVARTVRGPFRYISTILGGLELIALLLFIVLGGANPLGIGGLERWVAYLGLVWAIAFGGVLLPADTASR